MKEKSETGKIIKVAGPLVVARNVPGAKMYDVVRVSEEKLIGEIIEIHHDKVFIQVYEDTAGLGPGDPVYSTGSPLSIELGPGLLESIYDGIQRPLEEIQKKSGDFIGRGIEAPGLSRTRKWDFKAAVKAGDQLIAGDIIGTVNETPIITHKVMVPPGISGTVSKIESGTFTVSDVVCELKDIDKTHQLTMMQKWPVRIARPYAEKMMPNMPLITGQRVVDAFFPVAKGGTASVPGPFGSGKTVIQHQLAKWADAEIIIFVGCGERGNEMTDVLLEFPELKDPKSGHPLMKRTVLIANTSNMPVAARECSIYTGITIAEYFRDMGYSVAIMADSTSRWAEALREMSGRLEEMPGEEGYPAYLGTRVAGYYERAGRVCCLGKDRREGALTAIGAVSPPGGDLSEPVTQNTLRVVKVFWGLDASLAYARHFPAIHWLTSYSLYTDMVDNWVNENVASDWSSLRKEAMKLLQVEAELQEMVRLVGLDALSAQDRLILEGAKSIREDFLHQGAFDPDDAYTTMKKQQLLLKAVLSFYHEGLKCLEQGVEIRDLLTLPVRVRIARAKFVKENELNRFTEIEQELRQQTADLVSKLESLKEALNA